MPEKPDTIFQKIYDFFKNIETPEWLADILKKLQDIIIEILLDVGKQYLDAITAKIIEVGNTDMPNEEKFKAIFAYARKELPLVKLKDSHLNLLIELLVSRCKKERTI